MNKLIILVLVYVLKISIAVHPWEPQPGLGWWVARHERLVKLSKDNGKNIKIVFLGDSLTDLWSTYGKSVWDKYYAPKGAFNFGIWADTTQNVLYRIQNHGFDEIQPKLLVLLIGTNNFGLLGNSVNDTARGINQVITELIAKFPKMKILVLGLLPRTGAEINNKIKQCNEILSQRADNKTVFYLDMGDNFAMNGQKFAGLYVDSSHLSLTGYQLWYKTMQPLFDQLFAAK